MKQVNLDVLDGGEPVVFELSEQDHPRVVKFFDDYVEYKTNAENVALELKMLRLDNEFNNEALGRVSLEEYTNAINTLFKIAIHDTGGSLAAAQVLLGLYNGDQFHADLVDITCRLDAKNRHAAIIAIIGRGQLMKEPHEVIENGDKKFRDLWKQWRSLNVSKRYSRYYGELSHD